jgi:hypothetical protein
LCCRRNKRVRNTAFLTYDYNDEAVKEDSQWIFLPKLKRIIFTLINLSHNFQRVHFIRTINRRKYHYQHFDAQKRKRKLIDSFNEVYSYAGKAIIFTTFTLALSFSVFFLSVFTPNQNFAIVTISALIFALITDLLFLPALISSTTQIKKK